MGRIGNFAPRHDRRVGEGKGEMAIKLNMDIRPDNLSLISECARINSVDVDLMFAVVVEMGCEVLREHHGIGKGSSILKRG